LNFGFPVHFESGGSGLGGRVTDLLVAGRSRAPVVICGPAGSGKRVLARWLHFEGQGRDEPIEILACGSIDPARAAEEPFAPPEPPGRRRATGEGSGRGTLVLDDLSGLAAPLQARLLEWIVGRSGGARSGSRRPRLIATSRTSLARAVAAGSVRSDLAQRLDRLQLAVPPLCRRREEIPPLVELFGQRFAREEGLLAPRWSDPALALLWRQPWEGNLPQLENLVYKLVLLHPAREVGGAQVREVARRFGLPLTERLPSRHPERAEVLAALRTTLTGRGTLNKTRAATYLGWDPDTLVSRMRDLDVEGLEEGSSRADTAPTVVKDQEER